MNINTTGLSQYLSKILAWTSVSVLIGACTVSRDVVSPLTPSFDGTILNKVDFENGDIGFWSKKLLPKRESLTIVVDPENQLNQVAKFSLSRDDAYVNDSKRSELMWQGSGSIGDGNEYCYGFRNYIPKDWEYDPGYEVVAQWKAKNNKEEKILGTKKSPALALRIKKEEFFITNFWDERLVTPADNSHRKETLWTGKLVKGAWIQWQICAKWSFREDGLLTVWKDNKQVLKKVGPNAFNDPKGMKFKLGIYKPPWKANKGTPVYSSVDFRELYYDDIWMGVSH